MKVLCFDHFYSFVKTLFSQRLNFILRLLYHLKTCFDLHSESFEVIPLEWAYLLHLPLILILTYQSHYLQNLDLF